LVFAEELVDEVEVVFDVELVVDVLEVDELLLLNNLDLRLLLAALKFLALTRELRALLIFICFPSIFVLLYIFYIGKNYIIFIVKIKNTFISHYRNKRIFHIFL
jgi:hypothetical protein